MSRRSTFGLLAAALLVATVGSLATIGGSPDPPEPAAAVPPRRRLETGYDSSIS